ncbi:MAG: ComEC/Rec2 family competence protein [Desulfovibrionaceae bacterium]
MQRFSVAAWLPWHVYLVAAVLGLLGPQYPLASCAALGLAWLCGRGLRLRRLRALPMALCFAAGWLACAGTAPSIVDAPEWMLRREKVEFSGRVGHVESRPGRRLQAILEDVGVRRKGGGETLPAKVVWTWDAPSERVRVGDVVHLTGRLKPVRNFYNPGAPDFETYWLRQGVAYRAYVWGADKGLRIERGREPWLLRRRDRLQTKLEAVLPDNQGGAVLQALLMGDRFRVDLQTMDLLRKAGLAHTMALSGLHLGYMAGLGLALAFLAGRLRPGIHLKTPRPKLAVVLALPLALVYLWLGQATPSLVRAALMLAVLAVLLLRDSSRILLDGLFIAVGLMLAADPQAVFDLRLQLSALAVLGVAVFLGPMLERLPRPPGLWGKILFAACSILAVSLAANLGVLPVTAKTFGEVSPNLWLNALWLPLLGTAALPLGFAGLALLPCPVVSGLGARLLESSAWVLQWMLDGLSWLDRSVLAEPAGVLRPQWPEILGYALALALLAASLRRPVGSGAAGRRSGSGERPWLPGAALVLLLIAAPHAVQAYKALHRGVELELLDVGQGQAAVIVGPMGTRVLVDAGGFYSDRFDSGEAVVGPRLTQGLPPVLQAAVLSHPDMDHSRGLPYLVDRFRVGCVLFNGDWPGGEDRLRLERALHRTGTPIQVVSAGCVLSLGDDLALEALHPVFGFKAKDDNDRSLVLRLVWKGRGLALIPGDIGRHGERELLRSGRDLRADVLVLPHHGSKGALSRELYQAVSPRLALCSSGFLNQFGFPRPEVRKALAEMDIPLFVTGERGLLRCRWTDPDREPIFETPGTAP